MMCSARSEAIGSERLVGENEHFYVRSLNLTTRGGPA